MSLPHFHGADPFFIDQFKEGSLQPSSSKHSASITVQESTSIPTEVVFWLKEKQLINLFVLGFDETTDYTAIVSKPKPWDLLHKPDSSVVTCPLV